MKEAAAEREGQIGKIDQTCATAEMERLTSALATGIEMHPLVQSLTKSGVRRLLGG